MLVLVQSAVKLSFYMLVLICFFATHQILSKECMNSSQDFLGCTRTKKVEDHCSSELLLTVEYIAEDINVPCFFSPGPSQLQNLSKKC